MANNEQSSVERCSWCGSDPLYVKYHDEEWGKEVHDDKILFEFLVLESAQAGLSWITILRKRENYRRLFSDSVLILMQRKLQLLLKKILNVFC
jgi:DNA-3-methyladenine glycosylase I